MNHIELVFGHRRPDGTEVPASDLLAAEQSALMKFAALFRGGRLARYVGSYLTISGVAMIEGCSVVVCQGHVADDQVAVLVRLARDIAHDLEQEAVLLTIMRIDGCQHWIVPVIEEYHDEVLRLRQTPAGSEREVEVG